MQRHLVVWLDDSIIGKLSEENDIWSFSYDDLWLQSQSRFEISPHIPFVNSPVIDGSTYRPTQWFFDNLLPEEGAREVLSKEIKINVTDSFGLLEYYGAESAGALTLTSEGQVFSYDEHDHPLTNDVLSVRIRNLPSLSLTHEAPKKMSLAGAQNKLAVSFDVDTQNLFEPSRSGISTHILKPDHSDHVTYYNSTVNEWFIMRLAKLVGLNVPDVYLKFVPEPVFLIDRFDRVKSSANNSVSRLHTIDGCQLLNLSRTNKYFDATVENLSRLISHCRSKALARSSIFNWALFNLLIGNDDAHLKNLSFFVQSESIELTPFYDLLCTSIYQGKNPLGAEMAYAFGDVKRFENVRREHVLNFAEDIGVAKKSAVSYINKLVADIEPGFDALYQEFEAMVLPEGYGPYKAGALRMLREIKYNIMNEMIRNITEENTQY